MGIGTLEGGGAIRRLTLLAAWALAVPAAAATHYPPRASCNDCHALSQAQMVVGTRLIRKSQATVELGITAGSPTVRCLFCHREEAVTGGRTVMKPVWDDFGAQSASKHRASAQTGFTGAGGEFSCLDCHTRLGGGVLADGAGNASIHGQDASQSVTTTNLPAWRTLIGSFASPPTDAQLSVQTCGNALCHGYLGTGPAVPYGSYTAVKQHGFSAVTLHNIGTLTPTNCVTQCHGTHNSYQNRSLLILRSDGTSSNNPTDPPATVLTPDKCGECHPHDDGTPTHAYATAGHGKPGIGLKCTMCHSATTGHDFTLAGLNPLRFALTENGAAKSSIRQRAPYNQAYSICLTCHGQFTGKLHGSAAVAGCNDCHEPHGQGLRLGTATPLEVQAHMVRPAIPKISTTGAPLYGLNTTVGAWDTVIFGTASDTYRPDGQALCDSKECHQGRTSPAGASLYPLAVFLLGTGHSGGATIATTSEAFSCKGCHSHTDVNGSWGAGDSCTNCHAYPPDTNAHRAHTDAGLGCDNCHPGAGAANHNGAGLGSKAAYDGAWAATPGLIRNQVQVAFSQVVATGYRIGSYTLPLTTAARYNLTTWGTCAGVGCHGSALPAADQGTQLSPTWNVAASGACGACHRKDAGAFLTTGSGSHVLHAGALPNRAVGCQACHYATTVDGVTLVAGAPHANGVRDVVAGTGAYKGMPLEFGYSAPSCSDISCHGAYKPLAWGASASCDNCHGTFATAGGMATTVAAGHRSADWTIGTGYASAHTGMATGTAKECDCCHANRQSVYVTTPGLDFHLDGMIQLNARAGYLGTSGTGGGSAGCAPLCHGSTAPYQVADSGYPLQILTGQDLSGACTWCHGTDRAMAPSAPQVLWENGGAGGKATAWGSHLKGLKTDVLNNKSAGYDWTAQCNKCHTGHSGPVAVPVPPASWNDRSDGSGATKNMRTILGIPYARGIHLGGTGTGAIPTEAEICWTCHAQAANGVTEWGYNTKTSPAAFPVVWAIFSTQHDGTAQSQNYGHLYANSSYVYPGGLISDWTAGYWMDEYDSALKRRVASVHSASLDPAGQSSSVAANVRADGTVERANPDLEGKASIRCSYCHDVHDLNRADATSYGVGYGIDSTSGKPFLRGRWAGNPYPPELPPRAAYLYTTRINLMGPTTPRALATARDRGGFFIDQNSGFPTADAALDSLPETAELCVLCHGPNVDAMDFYKGSSLWRTGMVNGHSNSTLGGTGANKRDLFTASRYGYGMAMQAVVPNTPWLCGPYGGQCDGNYPQSWSMNGPCTGDCFNLVNSGWFGVGLAGTQTRGGGDYGGWYGIGTIGGMSAPGQMAHKFTCSKCHSPHATGLPALLTQNCIDPRLGSFTINGYSGTNLIANNCHRKTSTADGWHKLAPGQ